MIQDSEGEVMAQAVGESSDTFCVMTAVCPSCGRGSGIQASGICGVCPPGKYSDVDDVSFCSDCPKGRYNSNEGSIVSSDCLACEVGKYFPNEGGSECLECATGTEMGQALCSFIVDNTADLIAAFGNGGVSIAKGGETYIAKAGIVYTCDRTAGQCSDVGYAMLNPVG